MYRVSKVTKKVLLSLTSRFCFTSTSVKLHECNDASLNFNSVSFFSHPVLCTKSRSVLCRPVGINRNENRG